MLSEKEIWEEKDKDGHMKAFVWKHINHSGNHYEK